MCSPDHAGCPQLGRRGTHHRSCLDRSPAPAACRTHARRHPGSNRCQPGGHERPPSVGQRNVSVCARTGVFVLTVPRFNGTKSTLSTDDIALVLLSPATHHPGKSNQFPTVSRPKSALHSIFRKLEIGWFPTFQNTNSKHWCASLRVTTATSRVLSPLWPDSSLLLMCRTSARS